MAIKDPLIRHAISPPVFDERHGIHRERLVDAIHGNMPRKLIAIAAPAGYGKTTLLADFGANTELTVCWMRLSEAELYDDPHDLHEHFKKLVDVVVDGERIFAENSTIIDFTSSSPEITRYGKGDIGWLEDALGE